ncbi:MAG: sulfatase [Acidobacteriota bacterium]
MIGGILIALQWLACAPAQVEDGSSFDVLIYVLDACRADRIGAYGYSRPTTPTIDALAEDPDTVLYTRHYVAGNWTKPATASLFTSSYVHQHGVTHTHAEIEAGRYKTDILDDRFVTLAESFRQANYATFGLVTSHHLAPRYGFDQGFDVYLDPDDLKVGDSGRNKKLIDLIWKQDSGYFAYVHQNACHHPFRPHERDAEFMAEFGFDYDEASRVAAAIDFTTPEIQRAIEEGDTQLTSEDARFLSLVYDAKFRQIDREVVAPMIEGLRRAGRWDRTLLILTADHGEELYEHRGYAHAYSLWDEIIRVPLIVKFPAGMRPPDLPKRVDTLTSNIDFYPTLLELLGRQIPEGLAGRSIFDSLDGRFILSQGMTEGPSQELTDWALIRDWDKLIVERSGEKYLFDLEADPGETKNLAAERPERVAELDALGRATWASASDVGAPQIETELTPEVIERLRSLGYLE